MILTTWADGVGYNWTGFASLDVVRAFVGPPDTYKLFAVLPDPRLSAGLPGGAPRQTGEADPLADPAL